MLHVEVARKTIFLLMCLLTTVIGVNDVAEVLMNFIYANSDLNVVIVNNLKSDIANEHFKRIVQTVNAGAAYIPLQYYAQRQRFIAGKVDIKILFIEEANDIYEIEELPSNDVELTHPQLERRHLIVWLQQNGAAAGAMQQIFAHYLHTHYQIDVTVLLLLLQHLPTEESHASLYTFLPYERNACLSTQPVRIPMELALRNPEQLFPKKLLQFHGCSLSLVVHNYLLLMEVNWKTQTLEGGYDSALIKLLANHLQFNLELRPNEPPEKLYGEVYPNGTLTGVFTVLNERRANFSIGLYFNSNRWLHFVATHNYYYTNLMYITRSGRLYTPGELLLLPFDLSTWLLFLFFSTIRHILHYDHRRFSKICSLWRLYLALWLLACIVLRSAYEGLVFRFLHKEPHHPMPTTFAQLQNQGFDLLLDSGDLGDLRSIDDHFYTGKVARNPFEVILDMLLNRHKKHKAVAVFVCQSLFYYFNDNREKTSSVNILTENYKFSPICIYLPPFSYLANAFNAHLLRFAEVGLLLKPSHMFFDGIQLSCGLSLQRFQKWTKIYQKVKPISFDFMKWILGSLSAFYLVATFVFFIEIYSNRSERLSSIISQWSKLT